MNKKNQSGANEGIDHERDLEFHFSLTTCAKYMQKTMS